MKLCWSQSKHMLLNDRLEERVVHVCTDQWLFGEKQFSGLLEKRTQGVRVS